MTDQHQTLSLAAMFMIGVFGSSHCLGMCGGIATGLGLATRRCSNLLLIVGYNVGRIVSYSAAGALVATLGYWGSRYLQLGLTLRLLSGFILILMGLYLAGWWRILVKLEKAGLFIWRYVQPWGQKLMPVVHVRQALALGILWGWLPCGLVYTALTYAATTASPLDGAYMMAVFGLGTAPAMMLGGIFSSSVKAFLQARTTRQVMGIILVSFGLLTLSVGISHIAHQSLTNAGTANYHRH